MSKRITVFCSSSSAIAPVFIDAAAELGRAIAQSGWELVYGGNDLGSMGALANACRSVGGRVTGITPQLFVDKGFADNNCHDLIITPDMRSRKAAMEEMADAFITLPGGFGTLEELSEMLVGNVLKCHNKPVIILNIAEFYTPLLAFFDTMIDTGFAKAKHRGCYHVATSVGEAMEQLRGRWAQAVAAP